MNRAVDRSNDNATERFEFKHRNYTLFEHAYMALLDGLVAATRFTLKLGGRPLRNLLIVGFGRMGYWLLGMRRKIALTNLDLVYGDDLSETDKLSYLGGSASTALGSPRLTQIQSSCSTTRNGRTLQRGIFSSGEWQGTSTSAPFRSKRQP